jgi:N-dimethylarginine dimethylaminohydrolase
MEGNVGNVDKMKAMEEWNAIKSTYEAIGLHVHVIEGQPNLPDMVFCANQSLPFAEDSSKQVFMSIMNSVHRKDEVSFIEQWYRQNGYQIHFFDENRVVNFEGMGDALWISGRKLLFGGYGFRSSLAAYDQISATFNTPVVALELSKPSFYHLDTCFCSLNDETVLIYPEAFTDEGLQIIEHLFPNVIKANSFEAEELFACNATCPDGKNVLIQKGCTEVNSALKSYGFVVHELETTEYLKSGGSVFCMKMLTW